MTTTPTHGHQHGNHEHDEMFTITEAAQLLRLPVATLRYWRHTGDGPHSFRLGRHVRYWRTDLILWLTEQTNRQQGPR